VFLLTLFRLFTSMSPNLIAQSKEIAVMRALGVPKIRILQVYLGEAFILVFSSCFFGILIGSIVSWTMLIQQELFTQIPEKIVFPYLELLEVFIAAIISAFVSTYIPARRMLSKQIAHIIRAGA